MVFQDCKIEGDKITLSKKELEEARKHFQKVSGEQKTDFHYAYYSGKADMLGDILKMFEPIDFV